MRIVVQLFIALAAFGVVEYTAGESHACGNPRANGESRKFKFQKKADRYIPSDEHSVIRNTSDSVKCRSRQSAPNSTPLQCYTCDNCLDAEELTELQICGELPAEAVAITTLRPRPTTIAAGSNRTTTTTKATSTTANKKTTTKRPNNSESDEDDYSDDDEQSGNSTTKTTLRPGNIRTTTKSAATTIAGSDKDDDDSDADSVSEDEDEDEDEEDDDDDDRRRRRRQRRRQVQPAPRINEAVCYMIKVLVNDSVVTKRGCTAMRPNNILTCQSLHDDLPMEDCQLCDTNGCNKFQYNNMDTFALWNGAAPSASAANWLAGLALTALLMRRNN